MYDMSTFMFAFIEYVCVLLRILRAAMCFLIHLCTHIYNFWADPSEIILYPIEAFIPAQISLVQNDAWTRNRGFPSTFIRPSSFAGFTLWLTANSSLVLTALAPRVTMRRTCLYLAGRLLTDKTAMLTSNLSGVCFLLWK